jgi:hypothetical protein
MKNAERISKLKSCATVGELMEDMFPSRMDGTFFSYPDKRRLTGEWIECYKEGIYKPTFKYDTPLQLAEGIYPIAWDDNTMLFQELRAAFVEWVENYK